MIFRDVVPVSPNDGEISEKNGKFWPEKKEIKQILFPMDSQDFFTQKWNKITGISVANISILSLERGLLESIDVHQILGR